MIIWPYHCGLVVRHSIMVERAWRSRAAHFTMAGKQREAERAQDKIQPPVTYFFQASSTT
jgi:hypothetical protein